MTPEQWRERVGRHLEQRRQTLHLSVRGAAARAGFSEGQWRQMESGVRTVAKGQFVTVNPRPSTRAAASRALGWTDDSIDRLERQLEPVEREQHGDTVEGAVIADHERRLNELAGDMQRLDEEVAELRRVIDAMSATTGLRAAEGAPGRVPDASGEPVPRPQPDSEVEPG